jgi:hypothetical protein
LLIETAVTGGIAVLLMMEDMFVEIWVIMKGVQVAEGMMRKNLITRTYVEKIMMKTVAEMIAMMQGKSLPLQLNARDNWFRSTS